MRNSILVTFEKEKPNLIIEGIEDFIFLFESIFNNKDSNEFEKTYLNHVECYKSLKANKSFIEDVRRNLKGKPIAFNIEGSRTYLTAAIHVIMEILVDREFSCDFVNYSMDDIRRMQEVMSMLWSYGTRDVPKMKTICF